MTTAADSRYRNRSTLAALVVAGAVAVTTVLLVGGAASTLAMLARCGENVPGASAGGCRWLEHEDGWLYVPLLAASLPALACVAAHRNRIGWLVPAATLCALVIAVPAPFLIAG